MSFWNKIKIFCFFVGIYLLIFYSGTLKVNRDIANKSLGYFVQRNIEQANEAAKLGYIKYEVNDYADAFNLKWESKPGVRRIIRSGPDDFDDIGYISILELIALSGKNVTDKFVERFHNNSYIFFAIILSIIIFITLDSAIAGWLFLLAVLLLKNNLLSMIYGAPDSRNFAISFPFIIISIFFVLTWINFRIEKISTLFIMFFLGAVIGTMVLIRRSEGMMALISVLFSISLLKTARKQKIHAMICLFIGHLLITLIVPIIFALHRDIKTGEFPGTIIPYLSTTGNHPAWHSLVIGIGRYPNKIKMTYDDVTCYNIVRERFPNAMHKKYNIHGENYYGALQSIYFDYLISHPLDYLKYIGKSYGELFYFIPYATSVGNLPWSFGYLPARPGIYIDDVDKAYNYPGIVNLKYRYLELSSREWGVFFLALFFIILVMKMAIDKKFSVNIRNIFLSIGFYTVFLATTRAIIPVHGTSFVVDFWVFSILAVVFLIFSPNPPRDFAVAKIRAFLKIGPPKTNMIAPGYLEPEYSSTTLNKEIPDKSSRMGDI